MVEILLQIWKWFCQCGQTFTRYYHNFKWNPSCTTWCAHKESGTLVPVQTNSANTKTILMPALTSVGVEPSMVCTRLGRRAYLCPCYPSSLISQMGCAHNTARKLAHHRLHDLCYRCQLLFVVFQTSPSHVLFHGYLISISWTDNTHLCTSGWWIYLLDTFQAHFHCLHV